MQFVIEDKLSLATISHVYRKQVIMWKERGATDCIMKKPRKYIPAVQKAPRGTQVDTNQA